MSEAPKIRIRHLAGYEPGGDWTYAEADATGDDIYTRADLVPQWQPIKTAPKDGTRIRLFCPDNGQWESWWVEDGEEWFADGQGFELVPYPTHWQPLPAPPQALTANETV